MGSLNRSSEKFRLAAVFALVAFQTSCSTTTAPDTGPVGIVRAALTAVPPDVTCVRVQVQGARTTSQDFDVTPGTDTTLLVSGVSTGDVVVSVEAFSVACSAVGTSTMPSWVADPVSTVVGTAGVTDVSVVMHRNGQVSVGITFTDDPSCGADGGFCPPVSCNNQVKDGAETEVDCGGGTCPGCQDGLRCNLNTDCASLQCTKARCVPTCATGVQDGTETDVDCGGLCGPCADGLHCGKGADCASGVCASGICGASGASCANGIKDGNETEIDCGGGTCPPCGDGRCNVGSDCASGVCKVGLCAATCTDGVKDGGETDIDCGGVKCGPCADARNCAVGTDCASGLCLKGLCGPSGTCTDGVRNGTETDVDCGGGVCPPCGDGRCRVDGDCASGMCQAGTACVATCTDGVQDGPETDVDCGGSCGPCAVGKKCQVDTDCSVQCDAGFCTSKVCDPIAGGPVAWWRADDGYLDSILGLNAFPLGLVTFVPGIHGDGFSLDGSPGSAVEAPDTAPLDPTGAFTVDTWINPTENGGFGRIIDKIQPFGNDGYLLDLQGFHLRAIVGGAGLQTAAVVPAGTFTHVALTYSPGVTLSLYINGTVAATMPVGADPVPTNTRPVIFGEDQDGGSPFVGVLDDLRVWDQALDGKQLQLVFQQGPQCP